MHLNASQLQDGLEEVRRSPANDGVVEAIVIRPASDERVSLDEGELSASGGLRGDNWALGCWKTLPDGSPHPDVQIAMMNSRCVQLVARKKERWPLAGDQLFVDLDLSHENLRAGDRIRMGSAVLEITEEAHTGCARFAERFGKDALKFVNTGEGKGLRLRGIYAKIVEDGGIRVGDRIRKMDKS